MRIPFSASFNSRSKSGMTQHVKKSTSLGLIAILILTTFLPILGFILPNQSPVQAAGDWWNEDWTYRQSINLNSLTTQSNVYYQFQLDTSNATKFNTDCSDLRFISNTGQQIPHHLVSGCGTSNTQIQLLFSNIPPGDQDIYVYYGNPQATTTNTPDPFNNPATGITTTLQPEQTSPAPVAHWKFDEGYGSTTNSSTSTNYPGTINGAAWQQEDMCPSGKCLYFDGVDDSVEIPYHSNLSAKNFTVSMWFKIVSAANKTGCCASLLSMSLGAVNRNYEVYVLRADGKLFTATSFSGTQRDLSTGVKVDDGQWEHFSYTVSGGAVDMYLNGQLAKHYDVLGTADTQETALRISPYGAIQGFIDELKIYNYARTQQQIQQDYVRGIQSLQAQQGNLSNGLVGHWKMDEASWNSTVGEVKDSSGNNNHGQAINGATINAGKYGNGGEFNRDSNSYTFIPNSGSLDFKTNDFTIGLWVNLSSYTSGDSIIAKGFGGSGPGYGMRFWGDNPGPSFWLADGTSGVEITADEEYEISLNEWHYLVGVRQNNRAMLYIDGVKYGVEQAFTGSVAREVPASLFLGRRNATVGMDGGLDEVRLYNRGLASTEVSQLYTYAPKPAAYYDFEEGSGNTAYDRSGNNLHGAWGGTGSRSQPGQQGKSASFNGSDDYVQITNNPKINFGTGEMTISAWVKINQLSGDTMAIADNKTGYSNQPGYIMAIGATGVPTFRVANGLAQQIAGSGGNALAPNTWQFLTGTLSRSASQSTISLYLNGTLIGSSNMLPDWDISATQDLIIGRRSSGNGSYLNGQIDQVKIYNYARTPDQILQDMQSSLPNELNPIGYWKFDEGQGVTTKASSENSLIGASTGTLNNVTWANGINGSAVSFDGSGAYISVGDTPSYKIRTKTVSMWLKPTVTPNAARPVLSMGNTANWYFGIADSNRLILSYSKAGETTQSVVYSTSNAVTINEWHQYSIAVQDWGYKSTFAFYKDGQLINIQTITGGLNPSIGNDTYFGRLHPSAPSSYYYTGLLDSLKIYNTALTPGQIAVDYNQSSASLIGSSSTTSVTSGSGATTTQPSKSQDSKYCVPGSTDYCVKPVAHYDFEEGGGDSVKDISGNGSDGVRSGNGQPYMEGKDGKAGGFNGLNDQVIINDPVSGLLDFGPGQDFSIGLWVKTTTAPASTKPLRKFNVDSSGVGWGLYQSGGGMYLKVANGASNVYEQAIQTVNDNQWNYLSYTIDRNGNCLQYRNGQLYRTTSCSGWVDLDLSNAANLVLGSNGNNSYWEGGLDDIRIYNYARTPAQVAWDYNNGGPIAHYKMDECSGTTIHDSSGNNFHGILNLGSLGITSPGTCNSTNTAWSLGKMGKRNSSMNFDNTDDVIEVNGLPQHLFRDGSYTISAWVKVRSNKTHHAILDGGLSYSPLVLGVRNTGVRFSSSYTNSFSSIAFELNSGSGTFSIGQWNHILGIYNAEVDRVFLYINGTMKAAQVPTAKPGTSNGYLRIGRDYWNGTADGLIDDVQIFNYALTQTQIDTLYNGGAVRWGAIE